MSNVATLGHPSNGVAINQTTTTTTSSTTTDHHHHHPHHPTTTATTAANAPVTHTQAGNNNSDGLALVSGLGGPLGGSVVLGGQCECTRNNGVCSHGAGKCMCRGCTAAATTINPGINIGVSTTQYTAPVGTSGLGGGVAESGTGMSGVMNSTNTVGAPVNTATQNCECVKTAGVCNCAPGQCVCTNCRAHRHSLQATSAAAPLAGSEYIGTNNGPNYTSSTTSHHTTTTTGSNLSGPITDNSSVPVGTR
jgi:hypothetical protein